jgi:EAL domain-containing protein (putative c-di-GMP-specific phosphodiesterase class I)
VGSGYANFQHILNLKPDLIKLDIAITRNIDSDLSRRALAAAMVGFANETGLEIVAEGVETESELAALRQLGVRNVQGFLTGKPMPIASAMELAQQSFRVA